MTDGQIKELKEFVDKWKNEIPDEDIYFSFNGHGHLRYINANDQGLVRFGVKIIESAISENTFTNLGGGEYPEEDWIKEEDEDWSIHYIEKVNQNIDKYINDRNRNKESAIRNGRIVTPILIVGVIGFIIYLFLFWLLH